MSVMDNTPWRWDHGDTRPIRLRNMIPATGWFGVSGWVTQTGAVELYWEPVIAWVIERGIDNSDDEVRPIMRLEGGPEIGIATEGYGMKPIALHTDVERFDAELLASLREQVMRQHILDEANAAQRTLESEVVFKFVRAQSDPKAFAARMRNAGASSLHHAWLAITLAAGDPARAVDLARMPLGHLRHMMPKEISHD